MKYRLLSPGPTPVPERVLLAMAQPMLHHRTPAFEKVFEECRVGLQWLYQTKNDVLMLASSGTGAFESAIASFLSPTDTVVAVTNGKFGERWAKMAKAYGCNVVEVKTEWGKTTPVADIKAALDKNPGAKALFIVASESSTGVRQPVEEAAKLVKGKDTLLFVDAITALGVWSIPTDELGIDVLVTGSQKALMLPPGLAFLSVSDKAWKAMETAKNPRFYFDLRRERDNQKKNQTAFTPAVSLVIGLAESLKMMKEEGLQNVFARHERMARATRAAVQALGMGVFAETPAQSITSVAVPSGCDGEAIYKALRDKYNMTIAGGQDHVKGKIFRIAHLGYYDDLDILTVTAAVEMACADLKYPVELGKGVAAAQRVLLERP
ncbi:MAG: alanine--glyoxylate aminotransferase family protein [Myxococcota bacterium]